MTQQMYSSTTTAEIANKRYSFRISFQLLDRKHKNALSTDVLKTFGFINRASFYNRVNGTIELSAREKEVMDTLLSKHNLKWDYEHEQAD